MGNNWSGRGDGVLIQRIQAGDKDVFAELYRTSFSNLCDFAHRYVDNPAICEELVQDLFLNIWKHRDAWEPKGTIRSYLYKAVKNRALDHLKHLVIERDYLNQLRVESKRERESLMSKPDSVMSGGEQSPDAELIEAVSMAIEQLPERRKVIFLLSREDGLTYQEIAEVLDISIKTVETQMGRSLETLRTLLSERLPGLTAQYRSVRNFL